MDSLEHKTEAVEVIPPAEPDDLAIPEVEVKALKLAAGDILVVRIMRPIPVEVRRQYHSGFRGFLHANGLQGVRLLLVDGAIALEGLDEESMFEKGWIRRRLV